MSFLLSRSLPWNSVLRVWDMFFVEGPKVLFKVAVAAIHLTFGNPKQQKDITGFFELTRKLRDLPIECTHETILVPEVSLRTYTFVACHFRRRI